MPTGAMQLLVQSRWELYAFIWSVVRNDADAEDVFQDVVEVVAKQEREFPTAGDFRAWAREVARRQALYFLRRVRGRKTVAAPTEEMMQLLGEVAFEEPGALDRSEELEAVRACLERLPERSRQLIDLRFVGNRSYEEIASVVQSTVGAVRRAVARARLAVFSCAQRRLRRAMTGVSHGAA